MQVSKPQYASYIKGTVNEPTEYPPPNPAHGSYEWSFERVIAISLVPLIAAATVKHGASGALDGALALTLVIHSHYGLNQVFFDYFPKRRTPKLSIFLAWTWRAASAAALYGLYGTSDPPYYFCVLARQFGLDDYIILTFRFGSGTELNTNDIGLTETVARAWTA